MGKNVVREDVVKISYEADGESLQSLSQQVDKLGSGVTSSVSKADRQFARMGSQAQSLSQKFSGTGAAAKNGLGAISPAASAAGSGVKKLSSNVETLSSKLSSAGKKLQSFGKGASNLGGKLSLGITAPILGVATAAVKVGNDFEAEMSRVKAISGATGNQFQKLSQQAVDLGAQTAFSSSEAATGMENLASAGFTVNEITEAMPGMLNLAASSGEDLANSADIAASTLRGFGLAANQAGHVADVLAKNAADTNAAVADTGLAMKYIAPVAQSAGWSLESVTAAIGLMSNAGVKGEQAGTTLRGALTNLMNPSDVAAKSMKSIGFSAYDAQGKMKPLSQIVGELSSKTANLSNKQRDQVIATIMGTESLSGMQVLLKDGKSSLDQMTTSLQNSNGAADEMAKTMQDNTKSSIEQMTGSLETAAITVQKMLAPSIKEAADKVTELANDFAKLDSNTQGTILKIAGVAAAAGPVIKAVGGTATAIGKVTSLLGKAGLSKGAAAATESIAGVGKASTGLSAALRLIPGPLKIIAPLAIAAGVAIALGVKHARDEAVKADLAKRFGDITLSAEECADAAKKLSSTPWTIKLDAVSDAKSKIDGFKKSVDTAAAEMEKSEWKVNMGLKLSSDDQSSFEESADSLAENAVKYLEQKHYTANLAIDAIMMPGSTDTSKLASLTDGFYSAQQTQMQKLGDDLKSTVADALKDGVVTADETGGIQALQTSMQGMVNKAANQEYTAKLKALSVTASAGGLTADSFKNLTTEIGKQTTDALSKADDSLKVVVSELDMQLANGAITQKDYDSLVKSAQDSLNQRKADLQMKNYSITMEPLADKYKSELSSASSTLDSGLSTDFLGGIIPGSSVVKSAYSGISSEARDGLKKMVESAKPQTDEMEKTKQAWIDEGKVPPTAFMQSMQKTYELQAASGDITHQFDLLAGKINSSSATRKVYESMAKAGEEIPKELSDALKNEYGLVYEAGKGLIQKVTPEPSQLDAVKKMLQETGFQVPDTLAKAINDKGTDVAYQVKDLLSTLQEGYGLDSNQIVSLYTDMGLSIPKALADGLAKQEPAVQREVSKIMMDLEGGTHLDQSQIETFFKGFSKDLPDSLSKQVAGLKDSANQKTSMTSLTDMLGGQALNKSQTQSLLSGMNMGKFTGLSQGISKTADSNKQMQVVKELASLSQNVKLKSDDLKTLFTNLNANLPKSITDLIANMNSAAKQSEAVNLFGRLYTGAQLGANELKSLTKSVGIALPAGLISSLAQKSPAAQQAAVSLFQSVQSGVQASSSQLKSYLSSVGISVPKGLITNLSESKPAVQNQAVQLLSTIGTAADSEKPALLSTLIETGGEAGTALMKEMGLKFGANGTLVYTAKGKANQAFKEMDSAMLEKLLSSPNLAKILNSKSVAEKATAEMQNYLQHATLPSPTMNSSNLLASVQSLNKEVQDYFANHPATQTVYISSVGTSWKGSDGKIRTMGPAQAPELSAGIAKPKAAGGLVQRHQLYQVAEQNRKEMVIPLETHHERAVNLWHQAGQMLGAASVASPTSLKVREPQTSYVPLYPSAGGRTYNDHSVYAPVFQANFASNTASDREQERKVKKWVSDAIQSVLESRDRRNPAAMEV